MTPGLTKGAGSDVHTPGLTQNPITRGVVAGYSAVAKKVKVGSYQGTKAVSEYAVSRLNRIGTNRNPQQFQT